MNDDERRFKSRRPHQATTTTTQNHASSKEWKVGWMCAPSDPTTTTKNALPMTVQIATPKEKPV